jgi:hypothetical protein
MNDQTRQLPAVYHERLKIYENAVSLKQEGRVCIAPQTIYLPIFMYGETTVKEVMQDYRNAIPSWLRYHNEYKPDLYWDPGSIVPLRPLEELDCQYVRWPGRHLGENTGFQVLDHEFMSADEYVEYADDPTGFMIRKILPRHYKNLDGLKMIDLSGAIYFSAFFSMIPFALPPVRQALAAMTATAEHMLDYSAALNEMKMRFAAEGWPAASDYVALAPFDVFNDLFRGLVNTTMDMVECPDELLLAINAATKIQVRRIKEFMARFPNTRTVYFYLHNGTDYFMSPEMFGKFYWPGLKACIEAVIAMGGIARVYTEEKFDQKLDFLADVPKGKVVYHLINSDLKLAKKKLGGIACISGGIDGTALYYGTPDQVERNVRETLDIVMQDGGYILDTSVSLDLAKPENLNRMFETALKYGCY